MHRVRAAMSAELMFCNVFLDKSALRDCPGKEAEPFSDARTVSGRSGDKTFLAGFAAEAQSPMMIGDEAEPSTTIRAPVRHPRHVPTWRS